MGGVEPALVGATEAQRPGCCPIACSAGGRGSVTTAVPKTGRSVESVPSNSPICANETNWNSETTTKAAAAIRPSVSGSRAAAATISATATGSRGSAKALPLFSVELSAR